MRPTDYKLLASHTYQRPNTSRVPKKLFKAANQAGRRTVELIRLSYMLVADDIRPEQSGKLLVVGMYTNDIVIPSEQFTVPKIVIFLRSGRLTYQPAACCFV